MCDHRTLVYNFTALSEWLKLSARNYIPSILLSVYRKALYYKYCMEHHWRQMCLTYEASFPKPNTLVYETHLFRKTHASSLQNDSCLSVYALLCWEINCKGKTFAYCSDLKLNEILHWNRVWPLPGTYLCLSIPWHGRETLRHFCCAFRSKRSLQMWQSEGWSPVWFCQTVGGRGHLYLAVSWSYVCFHIS